LLLCAITDRQRLPISGSAAEAEVERRRRLKALLSDWFEGGVDFVQLREKDLDLISLSSLAAEVFAGLDRRQTKVLINLPASRLTAADDGLASLLQLCDGIHLPNKPIAEDAKLVRKAFGRRKGLVSMSCHSVEEILAARAARADFVFYAPVFEKLAPGGEKFVPGDSGGPSRSARTGQGLAALSRACRAAAGMSVFALGGVTAANAVDCVRAGSAGVAGIRLFQQGGWRSLRGLREDAPGLYS
jgi:thiamine-phosphate pyrophosphorylase